MVTVGDLLQRFNCFTVAACTYLAVFCMVIKEAIFEPTFENYFGLVDTETAQVAMIEGYTMIATSILIALVPDSKKNYNKLTLVGALIFCLAIFVEGPITLIEPARKEGVYWAASGVALIGIGEAFIMLHSMTALEESLSGVYPASKIGEVSNAMGSLISGANGAGNCSGIVLGALFFTLYSTHFCLELPSEGFQNTLKDKCDIDAMWAANTQHF
jgi:MFS family permease|tara:strand:- start:380 stop:1024 length:645 start_codon:yes stop_codon:yes gene_type:complete